MHGLAAQLVRLYLSASSIAPAALEARLAGNAAGPIALALDDGTTRALVFEFRKLPGAAEAHHWHLLCRWPTRCSKTWDCPPRR